MLSLTLVKPLYLYCLVLMLSFEYYIIYCLVLMLSLTLVKPLYYILSSLNVIFNPG